MFVTLWLRLDIHLICAIVVCSSDQGVVDLHATATALSWIANRRLPLHIDGAYA